jgi:hypothetical protein
LYLSGSCNVVSPTKVHSFLQTCMNAMHVLINDSKFYGMYCQVTCMSCSIYACNLILVEI